MTWRSLTALLTAAVAGLTAGCGAGHAARPSGRAVFAQQCVVCHSLSGRDEPGKDGGDLLRFHATRQEVLEFVREMPVRRPLTQPQLQAVVDYVVAVERRGTGR